MSDKILERIKKLSGEVLGNENIEVRATGEGYYTVTSHSGGLEISYPPVWIGLSASDREIHEKLSWELGQVQHPESIPDDLSIPNLQNEGGRRSEG